MKRLVFAAALTVAVSCGPPVTVGPPPAVVTLAHVCLGSDRRNHYTYGVNSSGWYILRSHSGDSFPEYLQPNNLLTATGLDPSDVLWQSGAEWPAEARWIHAVGGHRGVQATPAPGCVTP